MSTSGAVPPGYLLGVGDRRDVAHAAKNDGMTTPALPTATSAITGVRYRTATPTRRALEDMRRRRAEASERLRAMALLATLLAIALGLRLAGGAHGGGGGDAMDQTYEGDIVVEVDVVVGGADADAVAG
jgi:hypothetical protein